MILAAISLVAATQAPTYLLCGFPNGPAALDVTADEANGQVTTLVQSTGFMERRPAIFSPTEVKWSSPGALNLSYTLSRVDLSLRRVKHIGDREFPDVGKCKMQDAPKRAF
ncbi:hypothetical protein [Sphingopyxis indica]|uniref:hypothetical protein n=1 Tax=Sphingopyxis indica TaxID=436663 RepID=UPI00113085C5|nr:hypothetical protein [Sphingopyxis indica]